MTYANAVTAFAAVEQIAEDAALAAASAAPSAHNHVAADVTDFSTAADARITAASLAPSSKGVTNGDSHDHSGGDGAQIAYGSLSGAPTLYNQTIEDEGTPVTQRTTLNFTGMGVSVSDVGSKTTVSIPGGAGEAFPVGYIYISTVSTNPATVLGYGTWSAIAAGRVLVGIDAGDADFDTVRETRGSKTAAISAHSGAAVADHAAHTHSVTSNVAVADHASHTHTYTEVPNHVHVQNINSATTGGSSGYGVDASSSGSAATALSTANPTGGVATGTTAGPSATLTHSVTNNAVTSGNPSATLTHSVTQPDAHTDISVIQPSFVVYMFERTA